LFFEKNQNFLDGFILIFNSLIDFTTRNRRETEAETERIRTSQTAAERALEAREKAHRARVKGLEEQVISSKIFNKKFTFNRNRLQP
jgi:hypothetical protein